ncbi:DUF3916 domain-containing protein [Gottfriedia sp. NPDC056225]|uniref:DUF3916 domain-containing protein n=1 Tax=Gottfriedia sp. NPDC056225 TaxID=3345751 RepID=UPI0035E31A2E
MHGKKKKIRGLRRRFRTFNKYILEREGVLPIPKDTSDNYIGYQSYELLFERIFPGFSSYRQKVKNSFFQSVIDFVGYLNSLKTGNEKEYRIFCSFLFPDLPYAQVIIIYTKTGMESYYDGLLGRKTNEHRFNPIFNTNHFSENYSLTVPKELKVIGYEDADDGDIEVWLIGSPNI